MYGIQHDVTGMRDFGHPSWLPSLRMNRMIRSNGGSDEAGPAWGEVLGSPSPNGILLQPAKGPQTPLCKVLLMLDWMVEKDLFHQKTHNEKHVLMRILS